MLAKDFSSLVIDLAKKTKIISDSMRKLYLLGRGLPPVEARASGLRSRVEIA